MDSPPPKPSTEAKALVKYASEENPTHDFNVLNRNFDLFASPINFMHRRTLCEEIIYRAALAETQRKSPYASFRLALDNVDALDDIGVVVGVRVSYTSTKFLYTGTGIQCTCRPSGLHCTVQSILAYRTTSPTGIMAYVQSPSSLIRHPRQPVFG